MNQISNMSTQLDTLSEVTSLMDKWTRECSQVSANPIEILTRLGEIIEEQTEVYFKTDPDPFDDRHPGRADPNCTLGHVLKAVLRSDDFIQSLVHGNFIRDQADLNVVTCRLLLNLMPGLEASAVYKEYESSITKLFTWAEKEDEPLSSYSLGILAFIMEGQEHATSFKEQNHKLVPIVMRRLNSILQKRRQEKLDAMEGTKRPFSQFGKNKFSGDSDSASVSPSKSSSSSKLSPLKSRLAEINKSDGQNVFSECSNSSWHDMEPFYIASYQIYPVTPEVQQRLILSYLTPMGEYQELLPEVFDNKIIDLVYNYLDFKQNCDVRLAFVAVRYLASLLCHKKFGIEFLNHGGLKRFLRVPRPSLAATGVSLCLYYLAFFEDTMERVCLLPADLLNEMVTVVLWLLECSHQSGRMHAVMFLSSALTFKVFLEIFDQMDGLRKLLNVLSTSEVLNADTSDNEFSDDTLFVSRQAIRHVTFALKKYFESHACLMADQIRRSHVMSREGASSPIELVPYKAMKLPPDVFSDNIELLLECMGPTTWKPVALFVRYGGIQLFLRTVAIIAEWPAYAGRADSVRWILDVLTVCSLHSMTQELLCEVIKLQDEVSSPAISILLGMADTDILCEPEVQKSALNVINNLVCAPTDRMLTARPIKRLKRLGVSGVGAFLQKMWDEFRTNNGIMVLLKLLTIQTPLTGADAIRALACKGLVGLARSDTMCQIMSKLPLFNNGQLQLLMKEPVLQDKRVEHVKFCKYATELIERACGKPQNMALEISSDQIHRADVVAQTKIQYKGKELLQLIHEHLVQNRLSDAASALQKEAGLQRSISPPMPATASMYTTPSHSLVKPVTCSSQPSLAPSTPGPSTRVITSMTPGTPGSIRFQMRTPSAPNVTQSEASRTLSQPKISRSRHDVRQFSSPSSSKKIVMSVPSNDNITLDQIITSYLRKQHGLCKNPVVTCPPFSLYEPHKCPEPKRKITAPFNITSRFMKRQLHPCHGGIEGASFDRKFIYSRYKPIKAYKDTEGGSSFSCCTFSACEQWLMLGTYTGDLKLYNIQTGEEAETYNCHNSPIYHCEPSRDGLLLLTSSAWGRPLSALWSMDNFFDQKVGFDEDSYCEFSKSVQDRIVGTYEGTAKVYDVATGTKLLTLYNENKANNYMRNQATFNCTDDLVLNDGVLWDVDSGKVIHKFDKFNPAVSGVFHPMGLEVIINSEVWDLRTFKLLHTVPALDQCQIRFSHTGNVIYGAMIQQDDEDEIGGPKSVYGSSFRTFDARDYSTLATIDVKKTIGDLCTDNSDIVLAVIENQRDNETMAEESICRLYEVGQIKTDDDEMQVEDDEDEEEEEDDGEEFEGDGPDDDEILEIIDENDAEDDETDGDGNLAAELDELIRDQEAIEGIDETDDNGDDDSGDEEEPAEILEDAEEAIDSVNSALDVIRAAMLALMDNTDAEEQTARDQSDDEHAEENQSQEEVADEHVQSDEDVYLSTSDMSLHEDSWIDIIESPSRTDLTSPGSDENGHSTEEIGAETENVDVVTENIDISVAENEPDTLSFVSADHGATSANADSSHPHQSHQSDDTNNNNSINIHHLPRADDDMSIFGQEVSTPETTDSEDDSLGDENILNFVHGGSDVSDGDDSE